MLSVRSIAERTWASMHESKGPPPDDLLYQPWIPQVVRWVMGPPEEPADPPAAQEVAHG